MRKSLRNSLLLLGFSSVAALAPQPAGGQPASGNCGTWCVYGGTCTPAFIEDSCNLLCTNSTGGACGGSCGGGGFILYCSGDPT